MRLSLRTLVGGRALLILAAIVIFATWLFSFGTFRYIDIDADALPAAVPPVLGPFQAEPAVADANAWRHRREALLRAFEDNVYGQRPAGGQARVLRRTSVKPAQVGGVAGVEQWEIDLEDVGRFNLVLVLPDREGPVPAIILQNYCGNRAAFPGRPTAIAPPIGYYPDICRSGAIDPVHRALMGRWMIGPPIDLITRRGYALAMFYSGDVVPDHASDAEAALARMGNPKTGAIAVWAWMYSRIIDVLSDDPRFDQNRMIAWGHSRYGKVALLAGAADERISAVVALQSGRGGDALTRSGAGESVADITEAFPHWFAPNFARYTQSDPPIDQHQLLALVAPRALLLGHARQDGWSDPAGALAALEGAKPAFSLLGSPSPEFFVREGRHGIETYDWIATLDFLDERLGR